MELLRITEKIEDIIRTEILDCVRYDWDEDFITRNILRKIRQKLNGVKIDDLYNISTLHINTFKARGKLENRFGDISLIVKIDFKDGDSIEGVGFIEAKKRYQGTNQFSAIDFNQLTRIRDNAPHSQLLLYDYDPISTNIQVIPHRIRPIFFGPYTFAAITQNNLAIELNKNDQSLYKVCLPFSFQLTHRYFYGLDLEFSQSSKNIAKGYSKEQGHPEYAIVITITQGDKGFELGEINTNIFEEFKD